MQGDGRESSLANRDPPTENEDELQKAAAAIYDVTDACFDVLERLVSAVDADSSPEQALLTSDSASSNESPYDIRGLRNSFAFWIDYTGALASAGASLDDRLHGHDEIKEMVVELLEMVERNLHRLEQNRDENTPFSNAESQRWLSAIDSALDRLHFLASAIRKASARRKEQHIFNFVSDEDKLFHSMAISYVKWKCPNARPSLREHMGDSIAERRQALLQKHRHAKKLKTRRAPKLPSALKHNQSFASSVEESTAEPAVGGISRISASTAGSKATQASKMDGKAAMRYICQKPALSIRSSGSSQQGDSMSAEYPDPPRIKPGEKHVQCPYCLEPLPAAKMRNDTNNKYWRRHVDQDLQPYVCLYRRCTNSLFAHKSDWSKHMATAHSQEWPSKAHSMTWYCDLGHAETAVFDNETDWRKHMRKLSLHPGRSKPPTDAQLDALSAGKQKLARRDPYVCLFCEEKPQRIAILGDRGNSTDMASILVDHIAEHVKSLSFLSLPGLEGAAAEDDARSTNIENTSRKRCRNPGSPPQPASGVEFVEDISLTFDDDDGKAGSQVNKKLAQLDQIDHESNLADRLCDAMESYFDGEKKTKSWLPREALLDICQRSDIFDKLKKTFSLSDAQRYCDYVCGDSFKDAQTGRSAHKIFAILVLIKELEKLGRFVNSGYCDDNLPFTWDDDILQPLNPNQYNEHQSVFKKGEKSFMQSFHAKQWQIHVPFIYRKDNQALEYQLHPETIMPWKSRTPVTKHGGFAKVYMVDIHPGHHAFDGYNKFALKVLRPTDQRADLEGFQRELYALRRTTPGPHVIELLATFKRGGELSFLFPWADEGNLAEIMLKRPPELLGSGSDASRVLTRWLTEQCAGIAEGLHGIHDTQPQIRHDDELDKAEWKDNFGIHGDVKPENILMFKSKGKGKGTSLGELTLSDFGLSRFHSKDSRSNQPGGGIMSLTYASPEQNTYGQFHVSRRSDVWALGCVFSMLLTWAIRGPDALTAYHNARHDEKEPGLSERWHQDTFYGLNVAVNGERTIPDGFFLKKAVIDCIDENKNAISGPDRNSNFLIEFLDFIRDRMLKINFAERARSEEVCRFFDQHTRECGSADYSITLPTLTGSL